MGHAMKRCSTQQEVRVHAASNKHKQPGKANSASSAMVEIILWLFRIFARTSTYRDLLSMFHRGTAYQSKYKKSILILDYEVQVCIYVLGQSRNRRRNPDLTCSSERVLIVALWRRRIHFQSLSTAFNDCFQLNSRRSLTSAENLLYDCIILYPVDIYSVCAS